MENLNDLEALLGRAAHCALDWRRGLPERRVAPASTESVHEALRALGGVPEQGQPPAQVLEELVRLAEPGLTAMSGPRFFGWVTGGTLASALAADWLTSTWDQNAGPASGAPAAAAFELAALRWVVELLGLPEQARGALVTGATLANLSALAGARSHVLAAAGWDVEHEGLFGAPPVRVLIGRERHASIDKALRLLGFGKRALRVVEADAQGRMRPASLRAELDAWAGPVIVCAQLGNVDSGAFDPLAEIADALDAWRARHDGRLAWLHADGAFGLWARASRSLAALAGGAERADSWATDAHKTLNVPYDSGIVLTRHPEAQRRALALQAAYLASGSAATLPNPGALTPELSRRARSFALWAALRELGRSGVDALVTRCAALARQLARALSAVEGLRVQNDVVFNQVVLGLEAPAALTPHDAVRELCAALQGEGTCYATPTLWRGSPALRFSVVNAYTNERDIERSADAVRRVYEELRRR
ncbi:MAG TPA: pyridoxal-dependent decarboxylase [Polyangiaceae bacterium]|nr:pyridoxal-dependent decarboxylase [Polyangiaceae bacterium]